LQVAEWRRLCPTPTPPKNNFMNLGESWKGSVALVNHWRREKSPPPTPPEINFLPFGVSWEILRFAQDINE